MTITQISMGVTAGLAVLGTTVYGIYKHATRKKTEDKAQEIFKKLLITEWYLIGKNRISQGTNGKGKTGPEELRPIFNDRTNRDINKVRQMILNSKNTACKAPPPNLILTGLPGVGKTMLVETLCQQTGSGYIRIPSGAMEKHLNMGTHSNVLREIINIADEYAKESGTPTIIIMDDGEKLVEQRPDEIVNNKESNIPGAYWIKEQRRLSDTIAECRVALVNTILEEAGKDIRNVGFAITTNRPNVIDKAFRTRANVIAIDPPGLEERKQIIAYHLPKVFNNDKNLLSYFVIRTITDMAKMTEGFTGRNLVKLLEEIYACAQTRNGDLTDDIINACILTVAPAADLTNTAKPATTTVAETQAAVLQKIAAQELAKTESTTVATVKVAEQPVTNVANSQNGEQHKNSQLQETANTVIKSVRDCFDMIVASLMKIKCC